MQTCNCAAYIHKNNLVHAKENYGARIIKIMVGF